MHTLQTGAMARQVSTLMFAACYIPHVLCTALYLYVRALVTATPVFQVSPLQLTISNGRHYKTASDISILEVKEAKGVVRG